MSDVAQVMHSDIKSRNVFLTKNKDVAKIGDVGVAQFLSSTVHDDRVSCVPPCLPAHVFVRVAVMRHTQLHNRHPHREAHVMVSKRGAEWLDPFATSVSTSSGVRKQKQLATDHRANIRRMQVGRLSH